MTSGQKVAVSLLISVLLFAAFAVSAFAGLFSFVEARFYEPVVIRTIEQKLSDIEREEEQYSQTLLQRFASFTQEKSVQTFVLSRPTEKEVKERTDLAGKLFVETSALKGIRLVDANGRNIHYSSFAYDRKKTTDKTISYSNYNDLGEVDINQIQSAHTAQGATAALSASRIIRDEKNGRVIYSVPFYDSYATFRGSMLFYCDPSDFNRFLLSRNVVAMTEASSLVSIPLSQSSSEGGEAAGDQAPAEKKAGFGGYVFGLPVVGREILEEALLERLSSASDAAQLSAQALVSTEKGNWVLFSRRTGDDGFVAWLYTDDILVFSNEVKVLLLIVVFVTLFLGLFLLFNVKHDDMVVIRDQIRRFQLAFITEYVDAKASGDTKSLAGEITNRRQLLSKEIKKSLGRKGRRHEKEVDELLDKNWNEILGALGVQKTAGIEGGSQTVTAQIDTAEIKRLLEEVLESNRTKAPAVRAEVQQVSAKSGPRPVVAEEVVEEAEGLEDAEEVLEEAEPLEEAEALDEVEEVDEIESLDEAEAVDEVEEAESLEEVDEVESLEEAESVDEAASLEEVESVEEVEEADSVEDLDEVEELDEVEALEEADSVEELDEVESLDEAEAVDEVEEAESLEEVEEVDEVESLDEAEPLEEAEAADEVEEVESLEEADEIEEAEDAEAVEEAEGLEEIEEAEVLEEAEPLAEVDEAESVEEVDEVESLEEAEAAGEGEAIEDVDPSFFGAEETVAEDAPRGGVPYSDEQINEFAEALEFSSPKPRKTGAETEEFEVGDFGAGGLDFSALDEQDFATRMQGTRFATDGFTSDGTFPITEPVALDLTPEIDENPFIDRVTEESSEDEEEAARAPESEAAPGRDAAPAAEVAARAPESEAAPGRDTTPSAEVAAPSAEIAAPERDLSPLGEEAEEVGSLEVSDDFENTEDTKTIEESEEADMFMPLDDVETLESLDEGLSSRAFSLTGFASKANARVSYASSADEADKTEQGKVIVEDADGTFHISEDTKNRQSPQPLNLEFKDLVDSVLG